MAELLVLGVVALTVGYFALKSGFLDESQVCGVLGREQAKGLESRSQYESHAYKSIGQNPCALAAGEVSLEGNPFLAW